MGYRLITIYNNSIISVTVRCSRLTTATSNSGPKTMEDMASRSLLKPSHVSNRSNAESPAQPVLNQTNEHRPAERNLTDSQMTKEKRPNVPEFQTPMRQLLVDRYRKPRRGQFITFLILTVAFIISAHAIYIILRELLRSLTFKNVALYSFKATYVTHRSLEFLDRKKFMEKLDKYMDFRRDKHILCAGRNHRLKVRKPPYNPWWDTGITGLLWIRRCRWLVPR